MENTTLTFWKTDDALKTVCEDDGLVDLGFDGMVHTHRCLAYYADPEFAGEKLRVELTHTLEDTRFPSRRGVKHIEIRATAEDMAIELALGAGQPCEDGSLTWTILVGAFDIGDSIRDFVDAHIVGRVIWPE